MLWGPRRMHTYRHSHPEQLLEEQKSMEVGAVLTVGSAEHSATSPASFRTTTSLYLLRWHTRTLEIPRCLDAKVSRRLVLRACSVLSPPTPSSRALVLTPGWVGCINNTKCADTNERPSPLVNKVVFSSAQKKSEFLFSRQPSSRTILG